MEPDLVGKIRRWALQPGPTRFLDALRNRLVNDGKPVRPLSFEDPPLTEDECRQLIELFGNKGAVSPERVNLILAQKSLDKSGVPVQLRDLVELDHESIETRSERRRRTDANKTAEVLRERRQLIDLMGPVPQLAHERTLLVELPLGTTHQVPPGTRTDARAWTSYRAAIRAAAVWWKWQGSGKIITDKGLATDAFRGSKRWTDPGRVAFANLVGVPFDKAVKVADTEVRLRGPVVWRLADDVLVDAQRSDPWVSLPARSAVRLGEMSGQPDGVLLIENGDNFNRVCTETTAHQRWLCVWIKGFASDGLIDFVRMFYPWPLVAWCDLDPSGIEIIQDVERRTGQKVRPLGMTAELWRRATKRDDSPEERRMWRERAAKLEASGPESLRELARCIAATGERVEQEGIELSNLVIRTLVDELGRIASMRPHCDTAPDLIDER